jgi:5-methylthioadenosine/S-adenosylhomocysteine deaminase
LKIKRMERTGVRQIKRDELTKIIENGLVFTGDKLHHAGRLNLLVQNGCIADIGKPVQVLKSLHPSAEVIDAIDKVILPGFVDAHHSGESFILRYIGSGQPISRWNKNSIVNLAIDYLRDEATYEEFLNLYRLSYCAALKSGITTIAEYGFDTPEHSLPAIIEAMRQANVRGIVGLHNSDQIEHAKKLNGSLFGFSCAISNEENLTTYNFQSTIRIAHELRWPVMLHMGKTQRGCDIVKKNFNKSIAQLYADFHVFDFPAHLVHLACLDENDTEIIAKSGTPLILSPLSVLRERTNIPPFEKLFKHKVLLAFGSDWGAAQPLENIQTYNSIIKTLGLPVYEAYDSLALHTKNGAKALGLDNEIGTIEIGKKADIVFLDLSGFRLNAVLADENNERVLDAVLQEASSQYVSDVMIDGEFYVREGHLLTYSEEDLVNDGNTVLRKILNVTGQNKTLEAKSAPVFQLPLQHEKIVENSANEMPCEEGFKIVQKEKTRINFKDEVNTSIDSKNSPMKKINKVFGDDEV